MGCENVLTMGGHEVILTRNQACRTEMRQIREGLANQRDALAETREWIEACFQQY